MGRFKLQEAPTTSSPDSEQQCALALKATGRDMVAIPTRAQCCGGTPQMFALVFPWLPFNFPLASLQFANGSHWVQTHKELPQKMPM